MLYLTYSILLSGAFLVLSPYFLYRALAAGKYVRGIRQRLGSVPIIETEPQDGPIVWIHAVSVGELFSVQPLIQKLRDGLPSLTLAISTTTETSQAIAQSKYGGMAKVFYFPFDWKFSVRRAIERIKPTVVVLVESEIWPNFVHACKEQKIPVILVSGRISKRSYRRYRLVRPVVRRVLADFRFLLMQSVDDSQRILDLGAPPDRVVTTGNLKWDVQPPEDESKQAQQLDELLGLSCSKHLIVAGSTEVGEDEVILESFARIKSDPALADARLVIAPRKPERFDVVEQLIRRFGFRYVRRTRVLEAGAGAGGEVILLDTLGELVLVYRFASVSFVGGSMFGGGGHNVVEALVRGSCVIVGRDSGTEGVFTLSDVNSNTLADALTALLRHLLLNDHIRQQALLSASETLLNNRGAAQRILPYIQLALSEKKDIHQSLG